MRRIYLHGLGQTPAAWDKTVERLNSISCDERPDLAGMIKGKEASYKKLYEELSKFLGKFDEPVDLCGLSLGGVLGLNYAAEYPEKVNSLALIAAQYKMPKGLLRFQNILFRFMPDSAFEQTGFGKAEFISLCKSMSELDFSGSVSKIACPVLLIYGEKDSANKKASKELKNLLKNSELQIIEKSGHEVNIERPEKLAEVLKDFYTRISKNTP